MSVGQNKGAEASDDNQPVDFDNEDLMSGIWSRIEKFYHHLGGKPLASSVYKDKKKMLLAQVIFIESRLEYLIEVRDYLTDDLNNFE